MLDQADDTMEVLHNGVVERRRYVIECNPDFGNSPFKMAFGHQPPLPRQVPDTSPNEQVCYFIGGQMPQIIDVKWPEPEHCHTLSPAYLRPEGAE